MADRGKPVRQQLGRSLDRLVELAGDGRPWVALHASEVEDLSRQLDAIVVLDAAWPTDLPLA